MANNEMKVLSATEECEFLRKLDTLLREDMADNCGNFDEGAYYLGHGSSRMVFRVPQEMVEEFFPKWGLDRKYLSHAFVVKVSLGAGGFVQAQNEIMAYKLYGGKEPLAAILAYGQYIEIMENVNNVLADREVYIDVSDVFGDEVYYTYYYSMQDAICELAFKVWGDGEDTKNYLSYQKDCLFNSECETILTRLFTDAKKSPDNIIKTLAETHEENIRILSMYCEAVDRLNEVFGSTADNSQLGLNDEGKAVSYDYGFRGGDSHWSDTHSWSSPISDEMDDMRQRVKYVDFITESLSEFTHYSKLSCGDIRNQELKFCDDNDIDASNIQNERLDDYGEII